MNILDTIKAHKIQEVRAQKERISISALERSTWFEKKIHSLKTALSDPLQSRIIAEFKRKSPSKGWIKENADAKEITTGYTGAGATALSVLTNIHFFGAEELDFQTARDHNNIPILRKEFIVDEYQIIETKSLGADVLLLIAKMLTPEEMKRFSDLAHSIGLEVLVEFHTEKEIRENENTLFDLAGINNRNLNSFEVEIENSIKLANMLPSEVIKIAESGLDSAQAIRELKKNGFGGFLIGEYFMRADHPARKCHNLIEALKYAG